MFSRLSLADDTIRLLIYEKVIKEYAANKMGKREFERYVRLLIYYVVVFIAFDIILDF